MVLACFVDILTREYDLVVVCAIWIHMIINGIVDMWSIDLGIAWPVVLEMLLLIILV